MEDRVRAEKPIKEPEKWSKSTINSYVVNQGEAIIKFSDNNEVTVSEAIFELFTSSNPFRINSEITLSPSVLPFR